MNLTGRLFFRTREFCLCVTGLRAFSRARSYLGGLVRNRGVEANECFPPYSGHAICKILGVEPNHHRFEGELSCEKSTMLLY